MKYLNWRRDNIPNEVGTWLRYNIGRNLSIHLVTDTFKGLRINWGFTDKGVLIPLTHWRLKGWLWYGPLDLPRNENPFVIDSNNNEFKEEVLSVK